MGACFQMCSRWDRVQSLGQVLGYDGCYDSGTHDQFDARMRTYGKRWTGGQRMRESSKNIGMTKCFGHFLLSLNNIYLSSCHFVEFSVQSYKLFCKYDVTAPTFLYSKVKVGRFCSYDRPSWRSLKEKGRSLKYLSEAALFPSGSENP